MKKIFIVLLMLTSSLFAEEFITTGYVNFNIHKNDNRLHYDGYTITAILPYENGCILRLVNKQETLEWFVTKGFVFYSWEGYNETNNRDVFVKHTVTEIAPNKIVTKEEEF